MATAVNLQSVTKLKTQLPHRKRKGGRSAACSNRIISRIEQQSVHRTLNTEHNKGLRPVDSKGGDEGTGGPLFTAGGNI